MMRRETIDGIEWLIDDEHNRVSIRPWRDEATATKWLDVLTSSDCSGCSGCSDMSPQKTVMEIPVIEDIHRKVLEAASQPGCFDMGGWHCETTHCRGGWVVTLAGDARRALEQQTSTLFAAMQIYKASGYEISPCRFYDSNDVAMADMKRLAETGS